MGVHKGTDNFKTYRDNRQSESEDKLRALLKKAAAKKLVYSEFSQLVADMAERMGVWPYTLQRNEGYQKILLEHFGGQPGASTFIREKDASPELLRGKLIDSRMELGSLKAEATRQQAHVAALARSADDASTVGESEAYSAFSDTVWVLRQVLQRINADASIFEVDFENIEIRDLSAAPSQRAIVSGRRVKPFIEALRRLQEQEC